MTPREMAEHCRKQVQMQGEHAEVVFIVPGRWGGAHRKRLWKGGPFGECLADMQGGVACMFKAKEVIDALLALEPAPAGEGGGG